MKAVFAVALAVIVSGLPAQAASILDPLLGSPGDCYYRQYDQAHLKSHPQQRVESFYLEYDDSFQDPAAELTLSFGFTTRFGEIYQGVGLCTGNRCGVEGDGGRFTLTPHRDGLRLDVDPRRGMSAEGDAGYVDLNESDDKVFLLYPARPAACEF
jgi:hypothetical protein